MNLDKKSDNKKQICLFALLYSFKLKMSADVLLRERENIWFHLEKIYHGHSNYS